MEPGGCLKEQLDILKQLETAKEGLTLGKMPHQKSFLLISDSWSHILETPEIIKNLIFLIRSHIKVKAVFYLKLI